jgi:hypothetical protein
MLGWSFNMPPPTPEPMIGSPADAARFFAEEICGRDQTVGQAVGAIIQDRRGAETGRH